MKESADKLLSKYGTIEGWLSIVVNIILFGLKYWAGITTGSIAIIADAWHTLSDSISSIVVLISTKISIKPADKDHPYGHGRAELVGAIIIGIILSIIAANFFIESITELIDHKKVVYGKIALIVTIISIAGKELLARFALWAGKKADSRSLKADGWHHRSDALTSVLILIGIFFGEYFWWIDGVLGILVSIMIGYVVYEILRESISSLIGEKPDENLILKIQQLSNDVYPEDVQIHHIHFHEYGYHREMTFHILLPEKMELKKAHDIATDLENRIKENLNIEATIHTEPVES